MFEEHFQQLYLIALSLFSVSFVDTFQWFGELILKTTQKAIYITNIKTVDSFANNSRGKLLQAIHLTWRTMRQQTIITVQMSMLVPYRKILNPFKVKLIINIPTEILATPHRIVVISTKETVKTSGERCSWISIRKKALNSYTNTPTIQAKCLWQFFNCPFSVLLSYLRAWEFRLHVLSVEKRWTRTLEYSIIYTRYSADRRERKLASHTKRWHE